MRIELSRRAGKDYRDLPLEIRQQVNKQFAYLKDNLHHPSVRAKKYGGVDDVWQGQVNRDYGFYFQIERHCCPVR
jgi:mRNA interferase RelE/StbE